MLERLLQEIALFAPAVVFNIYFAAASIPIALDEAVICLAGEWNPNRAAPLRMRLASAGSPATWPTQLNQTRFFQMFRDSIKP